MLEKTIRWLGREFVALSCEGKAQLTPTEQASELFRCCDEELRRLGLSWDQTVRTRLWARDSESRELGSLERLKILSGGGRAASSSYIAPDHFHSDARIALDLLAMRPSAPGLGKIVKEYEPPRRYIRYLTFDSIVFLSGMTARLPTLADQVADILRDVSAGLSDAGSSWENVVKICFFLHRSQKLEDLKEHFSRTVKAEIHQMEYTFVDGYSAEGKLIEIEVTAKIATESVLHT